MEVSYEHANPRAGNESFLLRVQREYERQTPCILVDAGDGVDTSTLLGDDEYLAAILLTHAHLDHYQSLDEAHRDGAPIFTSPGTAAILEDVLAEGVRHHSMSDPDSILERVEAIDDWADVVGDDISVAPVPAGHTPGACGFLIRARDGQESFRALATGDFTRRDAGGYIGFDPEQFLEVDALFLTAATNDGVDETITDIVETLAARANAGSKTLCTASGLTGVHLATLLGSIEHELGYSVPVTLVGQVAKLYDALEYDYPNVETIPEFAIPHDCLEEGTVTIAGPEVPTEGSSERLFEAIRDDGNATLIQVQGGTTTAKDAGDFAGTVSSFTFSNHPTEAVLDEVVETIAPTHVVITHQRGRSLKRYKDKWDAYTWATGSSGTEQLYQDGNFCAPDWIGDAAKRRVRNCDEQRSTIDVGDGVLQAAASVPVLERRGMATLEQEGVDVARLREELHIGRSQPEEAVATQSVEPETETTTTQNAHVAPTHATDGGLYRTVDQPSNDTKYVTPNPSKVPDEIVNPTVVNVLCESASTESNTSSDDTTAERTSKAESKEASGKDADSLGEGESATETETTDESTAVSYTEQTESETEDKNTEDSDSTMSKTIAEETTGTVTDETVRIDPAIRTLAERRASTEGESTAAFVESAVKTYLTEVLRGNQPWSEWEGIIERKLTIDADPALEKLIATTAANDDASDAESFVVQTLCDAIGLDVDDRELPVSTLEEMDELIVATTENENCPHETKDEVVQAALVRQVL
ncbi:metallo-beta-lactamase superfamily domain-containing protein [Natrinema pellirubrum DSM 15624]|uniref:Exonuclease of the beta-lactamase fold involved in RNA processing n=1 Tax=Natrinema pellirubrum (strain DSM 15624 / CIP 106293 / JCM 10476 / NCIMB 786 / 157) TaxID=797303 RepID=L0JT87_NATP1|nr:MBL fold metallo-hydrolase [Natrinema pellirubrum]AGB34028.1 putative exonuclease of the beta-lactamase fold involved in RNA processing [Natrinema pellirubrum DSM 15624]ELY69580.1 metallo-beta-lactamase superfamily domain-containing protein [Natrinema pellirubrum DSM 15624]